jgi:hypothetical protein
LDGTEGVQVKAMDQIGGEFEETKVKSVDSFFDLSFDAVDEIKLDVSETLLEFDVKEEVSAQFPKDLLAKCCQERNQNKYVNCLQECCI